MTIVMCCAVIPSWLSARLESRRAVSCARCTVAELSSVVTRVQLRCESCSDLKAYRTLVKYYSVVHWYTFHLTIHQQATDRTAPSEIQAPTLRLRPEPVHILVTFSLFSFSV